MPRNEEELRAMVGELEHRWNKFSTVFYGWFLQHCFDAILNSMAGFVREKAGLGSPPAPFYTNAVESKNNILKQHLDR